MRCGDQGIGPGQVVDRVEVALQLQHFGEKPFDQGAVVERNAGRADRRDRPA